MAGVLPSYDPSVNQLLPPLIIQEHEVHQVIEALDHSLSWMEGALRAQKR